MVTATKFRKKPIVIEAMHWSGSRPSAGVIVDWITGGGGSAEWTTNPPTLHSVSCRCDGRGIVPGGLDLGVNPCPETVPTGGGPDSIAITTLEGVMHASEGDWVIRGVQGEFYPCKPDIFDATYEVEE